MTKRLAFFLLLVVCVSQSGCALFSLPGQIIGGMFGLASDVINLASTIPKPPPWMFF